MFMTFSACFHLIFLEIFLQNSLAVIHCNLSHYDFTPGDQLSNSWLKEYPQLKDVGWAPLCDNAECKIAQEQTHCYGQYCMVQFWENDLKPFGEMKCIDNEPFVPDLLSNGGCLQYSGDNALGYKCICNESHYCSHKAASVALTEYQKISKHPTTTRGLVYCDVDTYYDFRTGIWEPPGERILQAPWCEIAFYNFSASNPHRGKLSYGDQFKCEQMDGSCMVVRHDVDYTTILSSPDSVRCCCKNEDLCTRSIDLQEQALEMYRREILGEYPSTSLIECSVMSEKNTSISNGQVGNLFINTENTLSTQANRCRLTLTVVTNSKYATVNDSITDSATGFLELNGAFLFYDYPYERYGVNTGHWKDCHYDRTTSKCTMERERSKREGMDDRFEDVVVCCCNEPNCAEEIISEAMGLLKLEVEGGNATITVLIVLLVLALLVIVGAAFMFWHKKRKTESMESDKNPSDNKASTSL